MKRRHLRASGYRVATVRAADWPSSGSLGAKERAVVRCIVGLLAADSARARRPAPHGAHRADADAELTRGVGCDADTALDERLAEGGVDDGPSVGGVAAADGARAA